MVIIVPRAGGPSSPSVTKPSSASGALGVRNSQVLALPGAALTPPKTQTVIDSSAFKFRMFVAFLRASSKLSFKSSTLSLSYSCWGPGDMLNLSALPTCAHASDCPYNSCFASSQVESVSDFSFVGSAFSGGGNKGKLTFNRQSAP